MNHIQISDKWKTSAGQERLIDFPHDDLIYRERDYARADGGRNGYYRSESLSVEKKIAFPKAHKIYMVLEGVGSVCDVFIGANCIDSVTDRAKHYIDVSAWAATEQTVTLKFVSCENACEYTGLGLSGGISLVYSTDTLYIEPDGVYVVTESDSAPAVLTAYLDVVNDGDEKRSFTVMTQTLNVRSRRVGRRMRKFKLRPHAKKRLAMPLKMLRHYDWSESDAYLYTFNAELFDGEKTVDAASRRTKGLYAERQKRAA